MLDSPITEAVTLAFAPIFLLTGIGALLNVMTHRLGRVVDRARLIEGLLEEGEAPDPAARHRQELQSLGARITSANRAIVATSVSALLVCLEVALLFLEQLMSMSVALVVAGLFIATMVSLTVGLVFFLIEIAVATRSLKIRQELLF
ncbi:MAG: DUF2721 domain-containing protein [Pseudomonadota bacterium]